MFLCIGQLHVEEKYCTYYSQAKIGTCGVIIRLSGPLKECYARDHGLDFEKMLSASDYKEK